MDGLEITNSTDGKRVKDGAWRYNKFGVGGLIKIEVPLLLGGTKFVKNVQERWTVGTKVSWLLPVILTISSIIREFI